MSSPTPVELGPKLRRLFYEPLLLLMSLQEAIRKKTFAPESGLLPEPLSTSPSAVAADYQSTLHSFINKLAKTCDSLRGGSTVTGLAILQEPDRVVYVFASNNRSEAELQNTKTFVEKLLRTIKDAPAREPTARPEMEQLRAVQKLVFGQILHFHQKRIAFYIRTLSACIEACLGLCKGHGSDEDAILKGGLEPLRQLVDNCRPEAQTDADKHVECVVALIEAIYRHIQDNKDRGGQTMVGLVRERLRRENKAWTEFNHFAGRIASYHTTVAVLIGARRQWDDLFENFEVTMVPSASTISRPVKRAITANEIIGHMISNGAEIAAYRAIADKLQPMINLDDDIQRKCKSTTWKPIVHGEILVLDWIEHSSGGLRPGRFFGGEKYIGASKPSCALCAKFFDLHETAVSIRGSHGNFYMNWRMPDIFHEQGTSTHTSRHRIMRGLIDHIRIRAKGLLKEKAPVVKKYDSETLTTYPDEMRMGNSFLASTSGSTGHASGAPSVSASIDDVVNGTRALSLGHGAGGASQGATMTESARRNLYNPRSGGLTFRGDDCGDGDSVRGEVGDDGREDAGGEVLGDFGDDEDW